MTSRDKLSQRWTGISERRLNASGRTPPQLPRNAPPPDNQRRVRTSVFSPPPSAFRLSPNRAFSLIEVVAAVGIFAIGMVAVMGLFAPIAKSTSNVAEAEAATQVAGFLQTKLQGQSLTAVDALFKNAISATRHQLTDFDNAASTNAGDLRLDPQLLFASRDGTKIGSYNDPIWAGSDADKFFEIALIRNETLSPQASTSTADDGTVTTINPAATALYLAYTARIRWPAFVPDATVVPRRAVPFGFNAAGTPRFDHSQKQVLFVTGTITR